jgi:NDP-sugar pyrophosphorylase family protein
MTAADERQVVVLAGGLGTRLRSLGGDLPKALRPVAGRPFLELMLAPLRAQGFRRFHFCLGARSDQLARHLDGLRPDLDLEIEVEPAPCGTAGALLRSAAQLDEVFLLVMGDTYFDFDHGSLFDLLPDRADGLLVVTSADSGVIPNVGLVTSLVTAYDKAGVGEGWVDTGVAVLRRRSLQALGEERPPLDLGALFRRLIARRLLHAVTTDRRFYDIGTPERYRGFDARLRAGGALPC